MSMINSFLNFFKKDLRWKLTIISKKTGIKIFPDYFYTKGIGGFIQNLLYPYLKRKN